MFYWIYELPSWSAAFLFAGTFVAVNWLGAILLRPFLRLFVNKRAGFNDMVGYVLSFVSVVYGVLLGMLAIVTYQNLAEADEVSTHEAASVAALHRDISNYPDPIRGLLSKGLANYARIVATEEWRMQRIGIMNNRSSELAEFQSQLLRFEPTTIGQQIMHQAAVAQFNKLVDFRRMRLHLAESRIPPIMWYTVVAGALICMVFIWLFDSSLMAQLLVGGLASFAMSTVICLSALLDNPFRGDLGVSPDAFHAVYDSLVKQ
jgi:hypothetical protein